MEYLKAINLRKNLLNEYYKRAEKNGYISIIFDEIEKLEICLYGKYALEHYHNMVYTNNKIKLILPVTIIIESDKIFNEFMYNISLKISKNLKKKINIRKQFVTVEDDEILNFPIVGYIQIYNDKNYIKKIHKNKFTYALPIYSLLDYIIKFVDPTKNGLNNWYEYYNSYNKIKYEIDGIKNINMPLSITNINLKSDDIIINDIINTYLYNNKNIIITGKPITQYYLNENITNLTELEIFTYDCVNEITKIKKIIDKYTTRYRSFVIQKRDLFSLHISNRARMGIKYEDKTIKYYITLYNLSIPMSYIINNKFNIPTIHGQLLYTLSRNFIYFYKQDDIKDAQKLIGISTSLENNKYQVFKDNILNIYFEVFCIKKYNERCKNYV